jgi:hypothetical protein
MADVTDHLRWIAELCFRNVTRAKLMAARLRGEGEL